MKWALTCWMGQVRGGQPSNHLLDGFLSRLIAITPPVTPPSPEESELGSCSSDSNDSSAYIPQKHAYKNVSRICNSQTPGDQTLSNCYWRDLMPQMILLAENAFNEYFIVKNVTNEEKVKFILGAFKDLHIQD